MNAGGGAEVRTRPGQVAGEQRPCGCCSTRLASLHAAAPRTELRHALAGTHPKLQEQEISALEDAIRNRLAGRRGTSGKAERLAAKKAAFSQNGWARISQYMAFMAREDEARRAAQERATKKAAAAALEAATAEALQRKCVPAGRGGAHDGMLAVARTWCALLIHTCRGSGRCACIGFCLGGALACPDLVPVHVAWALQEG